MAFNGKLITVGSGTEIPLKFILIDTYYATPNQRQDVDSYRDLEQDLHRTVSGNYKSIVKFKTRELNEAEKTALWSIITDNYSIPKERKIPISFYDPETAAYYSGSYYLVQPVFQIKKVDQGKPDIIYDSMDIQFIQY